MTGKRKRHRSTNSNNPPALPAEAPSPPPQVSSPLPAPTLQIDGSQGEGGGQIVRASLALSAVLCEPIGLTKIRAARPCPGLKAQHAAGVHLVATLCNGALHGGDAGSVSLTHHPGAVSTSPTPTRTPVHAVVSTAGATTLVLQAGLPPALVALPSTSQHPALVLSGGTTVPFAPITRYAAHVLAPALRHFGVNVRVDERRHGVFPRGGGEIAVFVDKSGCALIAATGNGESTGGDGAAAEQSASDAVEGTGPRVLRSVCLTSRSEVVSVHARVLTTGRLCAAAGLGETASSAVARGLRRGLANVPGVRDTACTAEAVEHGIETEHCGMNDVCAGITVWAVTADGPPVGASRLWTGPGRRRRGERGDDEELHAKCRDTVTALADEAVCELVDALRGGAAVDAHLADQLVVFMVMAQGQSRVLVPPPSLHARTVVDVVTAFGVQAKFEDVPDSENKMLVCEGKSVPLKP